MLDPGSFIISDEKLDPQNASEVCLEWLGKYLYYRSPLFLRVDNENMFMLIGLVEEGDALKSDIRKMCHCFTGLSPEEKKSKTKTWVGRWLMISEWHILCDSWSSYSVYKKQGEPSILYSSIGLLNKIGRYSFDDYMGHDATIYKDSIERLSPIQYYNMKEKTLEFYENGLFVKRENSSISCLGHIVFAYPACALQRLLPQIDESHFYLPLTAGRDSRLSLSVALSSLPREKLSAYTFAKPIYAITLSDFLLPKILSFMYRFSYFFIRGEASVLSQKPLQEFLGTKKDLDVKPGDVGYYIIRDYFKNMNPKLNSIVITSLFYDLIEGTYGNYARKNSWYEYSGFKGDKNFEGSCENFLKRLSAHHTVEFLEAHGYSYLYVRHSYLEKLMSTYNYVNLDIFTPAICDEFNELALTIDVKDLLKAKIHRASIKSYSKVLAYIPFNFGPEELRIYVHRVKRLIYYVTKYLRTK